MKALYPALALLLLGGCTRVGFEWTTPEKSCSGADCATTIECSNNGDCPEVCIAGNCADTALVGEPCDEDEDCAATLACAVGVCRPTCIGSTATSHAALGAGTATDPYLLCTPLQLLDLMHAAGVAWQASYRLGADIDLSGFDAWSTPATSPIGDASTPFSGSFDGAGHAIANFAYSNDAGDGVGFFGHVAGARSEIRDLTITSATVTGGSSVGVMVGRLDDGALVTHCSSSGSARALELVGGLVGVVGDLSDKSDGALATVSSSWSTASTESLGGLAGGLIGSIGRGSVCINSFAAGQVSGVLGGIGGLVGASLGRVINSFASGDVIGGSEVGGLVGSALGGDIINSFAVGDVAGNDCAVGRLVGEAFSVTNSFSYAGTACTLEPDGCHEPVPGETSVGVLAHFHDPTQAPLSSWDFANSWVATTDLPYPSPHMTDMAAWGTCNDHQDDAPFAGGLGTLEAPFLICTRAQLRALGEDSALWSRWLAFRLMADLDLTSFTPPSLPIANFANPFHGFFDGNGKTIAHLDLTGPADDSRGLFGACAGYIRRLGLTDAAVTGWDNQGILVGTLIGGAISNCYAMGSVSGGSKVGGLVGDGWDFVVTNSYFVGSVTATDGGGLVGAGNAELHRCFASAAVQVTSGGGPLAPESIATSNAFDSSKACTGCTNANGLARAPTSTFYDPGLVPLSTWDFKQIWTSNAPTGFPTLR